MEMEALSTSYEDIHRREEQVIADTRPHDTYHCPRDHGLEILPGTANLTNFNLDLDALIARSVFISPKPRITKLTMLAWSAYRGFVTNKNSNPNTDQLQDKMNKFALDTFQGPVNEVLSNPDKWVKAPGVFSIPICDFGTWKLNHKAWGAHTIWG